MGGDLDAFEKAVKTNAPAWLAYELRAMTRRYQADGAVPTPDDIVRLTALRGHPPLSHRDFAPKLARSWQA